MGEKNDPRDLCDQLSFLNFKHVIINNTQFVDTDVNDQMLKESKGRKRKCRNAVPGWRGDMEEEKYKGPSVHD